MRHNLNAMSQISNYLQAYESQHQSLPGISNQGSKDCFIKQIIDSIRRIQYVQNIAQTNKAFSTNVLSPHHVAFDPLKTATHLKRNGKLDEAFWVVFLATHFGKHKKKGWELTRLAYGNIDQSPIWSWNKVLASPDSMGTWIDSNSQSLKNLGGGFGNHRRYSTLKFSGTGRCIKSYVEWVSSYGGHANLISRTRNKTSATSLSAFADLYNEMDAVTGFGRLGKFDYLTMVGKLNLADIEPDNTYMRGATGPIDGARLLFYGSSTTNVSWQVLDQKLQTLSEYLPYTFVMQILEDSLCNWQKSSDQYEYFNG